MANHKYQMVRQAHHPEPVEGQITMTKIQNLKHILRQYLVTNRLITGKQSHQHQQAIMAG
jgi:hypothetical protein